MNSQISYSETETKHYNILYINSYHSGFSWSDNIENGFISEMLNLEINYELYIERLESKRIKLNNSKSEYKNLIKKKYHNIQFDVVVTSDDNAFNFAAENREELFPNVPIVFSGVNDKNNTYLLNDTNIAGVIEDVDISGLIKLILEVQPKTTHIAIIGDQTESAVIHINNTVSVLKNQYPELEYSIYNSWTLNSLADELNKLQKSTVVIELAFHLDKNAEPISFNQERDFFKNRVNIPSYSLWDSRLNYGITGGVIASGTVHGQVAAQLATSILKGNFPENPILSNIPFPTYFDYREVERFGISFKNIPKAAIFINRPDTLWLKYKNYIIMIIIFTIAQIVLIIFLILNIHYRRIAKKKLLILNKELEDKVKIRTNDLEESLKNLQLTQKSLIESEKMASLGSLVTGISHQINTPLGICKTISSFMKDKITENPSDDLQESIILLEKNIDKVATIINNFRQVSVDFTSESLTSINMSVFINQVISSQESKFQENSIRTSFDCPKNLVITTYTGVLLKVFIILFKNSIMHGFDGDFDAPKIAIVVTDHNNYISIKYSDNGKGIEYKNHEKIFDPFYTTKLGKGNSGLGLNIAYNEIVHRLKGTITTDFSNERGLSFIIDFPKDS